MPPPWHPPVSLKQEAAAVGTSIERLRAQVDAEASERAGVQAALRDAAQQNAELVARVQTLEVEVAQARPLCPPPAPLPPPVILLENHLQ